MGLASFASDTIFNGCTSNRREVDRFLDLADGRRKMV